VRGFQPNRGLQENFAFSSLLGSLTPFVGRPFTIQQLTTAVLVHPVFPSHANHIDRPEKPLEGGYLFSRNMVKNHTKSPIIKKKRNSSKGCAWNNQMLERPTGLTNHPPEKPSIIAGGLEDTMVSICASPRLPQVALSCVFIASASVLGSACNGTAERPKVSVGSDGFFDSPWPSDHRLVNGRIDLADFPGIGKYALLDRYVEASKNVYGFGTSSPIYLPFDGPLKTQRLPDPQTSGTTKSSVLLVNIDPNSPGRGELVPFEWDFYEEETRWHPSNLLAIQPVWGMPLRPETTYAAIITTDIAVAPDGFDEWWEPTHPEYACLIPLQETLFQLHVDREEVAYATLFTTRDTTNEMARLAHQVHEELSLPRLDQELEPDESNLFYKSYEGMLFVPIWQHGEWPYLTEGGGFAFDSEGIPILAEWEAIEFTFTVPVGEPTPEDGWPVVIYSHGTGGNRKTFANESNSMEIASKFARAGLAGFGISLPFHGDRQYGVDPTLASFNYFNPESGISTFRQAALEQIYLADLLTQSTHTFWDASGDLDAFTNPEKVAYMGHSHGAEVGSIAIPFFPDALKGVVISGAGGGVTLSILYREGDDLNIQELLRDTFEMDDDDPLEETHPILGVVQAISEITDPLNYAPYWHANEPDWASTPRNVLMFEGLEDVYTPPIAIEAMAGAAQHPILAPVAQSSMVQELQDIDGTVTPTTQNIVAWDGSKVTGGLAQYPDQGHFAVFNDQDAATLYQDFLSSTLNGISEIPEHN